MKGIVFLLALFCFCSSEAATPDLTGASRIDESYRKIWAEQQVEPAARSTDQEFMRRVYLDLTGSIPAAEQARVFIQSGDQGKRTRLIASLLDSAEYADYFASIWTNLFLGHEKNRIVDREAFHRWFEQQFARNTGWDRIAYSLVAADGNLRDNPQLNWFVRNKLDAANLADDTARNLLGIQLGCARCHNHPHDKWKLEDFYGLAAFYDGMEREKPGFIGKLRFRSTLNDQKEVKETVKKIKENGKKMNQEELADLKMEYQSNRDDLRALIEFSDSSSRFMSAEIKGETKVYPAKFLLAPEPIHYVKDKRRELARWLISPENPYFARAFVNRVWGMMMGKGFVEPVDKMSDANPPSNPALLEFLAEDFKRSRFDVKRLLFNIAASDVYQLSSAGMGQDAPVAYERGKLEMMNAEQLLNSSLTATSIEDSLKRRDGVGYEEKREMIYRYYVFLFNNDEDRGKNEFQGTVSQALFLLNGKMTNDATASFPGNTTSRILSQYRTAAARIDALYLGALTRFPTPAERDRIAAYVKEHGNRETTYQDILWALLNSNEFLFNH